MTALVLAEAGRARRSYRAEQPTSAETARSASEQDATP